MPLLHVHRSLPRAGAALAVGGVLLLGCARKVQIELPAGFHGHVHITCTGFSDDPGIVLRVDSTGQATTATCPERRADAVVTRAGSTGPVEATVMWTTTGDGIVRAISFDVP